MRIHTIRLAIAFSLLAAPAFAADLRGEIVNASEHAEYAAEAADLATAHMHLHHALNCLVGPDGAGFDKTAINPCAHAGNGIIPDSTDAALTAEFQKAAAKSREGLATDDLAKAKDAATQASKLMVATLKKVK
jgi:hypothetical protein